MCIKGVKNGMECGYYAGVIGLFIGSGLMGAGIAVFLVNDTWTPLAIGLMASGAPIFTLCIGGGCVIMGRMNLLQQHYSNLLQRVSQLFRQNEDNL